MSAPRWVRSAYNWTAAICDPLRVVRGVRGLGWYAADWFRYRRLDGAEAAPLLDLMPSLHEHSATHEIDAHYFYLNAWAARRVASSGCRFHLDVASQTMFAALLSATIPVVYIDYRPFHARLSELASVAGSLLALPLREGSVTSLSCLHVAEHVGLGRYGDPLDPHGTRKAARELARVLAPGGSLYFAVPVGRERLCFNAHRILRAETVTEYFSDLELVEHSGVHDNGRFVERVAVTEFAQSEYACGMFHFRKARA